MYTNGCHLSPEFGCIRHRLQVPTAAARHSRIASHPTLPVQRNAYNTASQAVAVHIVLHTHYCTRIPPPFPFSNTQTGLLQPASQARLFCRPVDATKLHACTAVLYLSPPVTLQGT
ncbi:hypothetical protein V8C34DRAFT_289681 [Trichoderma compactum]